MPGQELEILQTLIKTLHEETSDRLKTIEGQVRKINGSVGKNRMNIIGLWSVALVSLFIALSLSATLLASNVITTHDILLFK